jgi:hypothetical protein
MVMGVTKCPHCNSDDIVTGVKVGAKGEATHVGLYFRGVLFKGIEPMYGDLCKGCGTLIRFFVKNTEKDWLT